MIFWMMPDSSVQTKAVMEEFLLPFKRENPDADIEIKVIPRRTLWMKMFALKHEIGQPDCPDIIAIPHYWTQLLTKANALVNLTELDKTLRVDNCLDPLKPHCYKQDSVDIYSYPWWFDITALHYREDHLKLITDNPEEQLSTWAGFLDAAQKLKEYFNENEGYMPVQNTDWRGSLSHRAVLPCLWSKGAYILNMQTNTAGFGDPLFREGMQDFIDLAVKHYMPILVERSSLGTISSGKASMVMSRKQGLSAFEGANTDVKVKTLPIPTTGNIKVNYLGGVNLAIVRGGRNTEQALNLLKWLTKGENQIKYSALTEVFPAKEAAFESFLLSSPHRIQNYTNIIANARTLPNHLATGTLMEIMANIMTTIASAIVQGKYTKEELRIQLKRAEAEAKNILTIYND